MAMGSGLLDWLGDALGMGGGGGRGMSLDVPPSAMRGMPPMQDMGGEPPSLAPMMAERMPPGVSLPPAAQGLDIGPDALRGLRPPAMGATPEPMMPPGSLPPPMPEAPRYNPAQSELPPGIGPAPGAPPAAPPVAGGAGMPSRPPAGPPMNIAPSGAPPVNPASIPLPPMQMQVSREAPGSSMLGRALGMSRDAESGLRSSLAGGLQGVAQNWNKPGLAAFAGGAAGALKGGEEADRETEKRKNTDYDQRIKALNAAITARKVGDDAAYKTNWLKYQVKNSEDRLELAKEKMAKGVGASGRSAWNKPDSQKVVDIENALARDEGIKGLRKRVDAAGKIGIQAEVDKAQSELDARVAERRKALARAMGISPKTLAELEGNPFGTQTNPHDLRGIRKSDFGNYVKPGEWFINPKDGRLLQAKGGASSAASPPTSSVASPPAAVPAAADDDDDDEE